MTEISILIYSVLNLGFGGRFERWISEVSPRLSKRGNEVYVVTTEAGSKHTFQTQTWIELDNYKMPTIPKLKQLKIIKDISKETDVIHFNNSFAFNEVIIYLIKNFLRSLFVQAIMGIFLKSVK
jgi:hypothetical protein